MMWLLESFSIIFQFFGGAPRPMPPCTPFYTSPPPGIRPGSQPPVGVVPHILPPMMFQGMPRPPQLLGPPPPFPPPGFVCSEPQHLQLRPPNQSPYSTPAEQGLSHAPAWGSGASVPYRPGAPKHVTDQPPPLSFDGLGTIAVQPLIVPGHGQVIGGPGGLQSQPPVRFPVKTFLKFFMCFKQFCYTFQK